MKALSVNQPWAVLLVSGLKDVENRTWRTHHRGPLLIHASRAVDQQSVEWLTRNGVTLPARYVTGAIIGVVDLYACEKERSSLWHEFGRFGWYVRNALMFEHPVPCKGKLNLFEVPDEKVPEVRQWGQAA